MQYKKMISILRVSKCGYTRLHTHANMENGNTSSYKVSFFSHTRIPEKSLENSENLNGSWLNNKKKLKIKTHWTAIFVDLSKI